MTTICFKTPAAPAVAPAPQRADVVGDVTDARTKLASQQGITSNIFTSALGDSGYNKNARNLATLGGGSGSGNYGNSGMPG